MDWRNILFLVTLCYLKVQCSDGYVEAIGASLDTTQARWETQVAMMCDKNGAKYHNQYMDESGRWVTDLEHNKGCMKSKSDILDYCKLVYPGSDFLNVVQSTHSHLIEDWCKVGHKKCKGSFWVQPFQCLQGDSESPSLSVPDTCLFDQLKNVSLCKNFHSWSKAANKTCKDYGLGLYSILTQYPCGSEVFNGAEFVCCPRGDRKSVKKSVPTKAAPESEIESITSGPDAEEKSTRDPYFTKFDPRIEHDAFQAAERRLESAYHRKITKIMKEWTELEERYQKIKYKSPQKADKFKLKMTERFNRMMNALKDQGYAEKHQLVNLHQQRIIAHINERKKDGMKCFVKALNDKPQSTAAVKRCLTHLIKALHKDRHHTISRYNHLLLTNQPAAVNQKDSTIEHLQDVDRMLNESLQMLDHYPDLKEALLTEMTRLSAERRILIALPDELQPTTAAPATTASDSDEADYDDESDEEDDEDDDEDDDEVDDVPRREETLPAADDPVWNSDDANRIDIDVQVERQPMALPERLLEPVVAHVRTHEHVQGEATFRVVGEVASPNGGRGIYLTVALASLALTMALVAAAWAVRRRQRAPHHQGFIEVDQTITPEERHLAQMQGSGYENPTYRYFESK